MEWLTNLLGKANGGSSPFGALGGGGGGGGGNPFAALFGGMGGGGAQPPPTPPPMMPGQAPGQAPAGPPQMPAGQPVPFMNPQTGAPAPTPGNPQAGGLPGLLGQMMNRPQGNNQGALMNQAMSMLRPPQMQPTQWMAPWQRR